MWSLKRKCQFDEIFIDISVSVVDWASDVLCYKRVWMTRRMQKMAWAAVVQTTSRNPLMYIKYHDATFTLSLRHGQFEFCFPLQAGWPAHLGISSMVSTWPLIPTWPMIFILGADSCKGPYEVLGDPRRMYVIRTGYIIRPWGGRTSCLPHI